MPSRPNYNQQRNDRDRAKQQKQQEKLRRREDESARRKAGRMPTDGAEAEVQTPAPETPSE
jgi:hypothetical protein